MDTEGAGGGPRTGPGGARMQPAAANVGHNGARNLRKDRKRCARIDRNREVPPAHVTSLSHPALSRPSAQITISIHRPTDPLLKRPLGRLVPLKSAVRIFSRRTRAVT